jgi:hypothetical protein
MYCMVGGKVYINKNKGNSGLEVNGIYGNLTSDLALIIHFAVVYF